MIGKKVNRVMKLKKIRAFMEESGHSQELQNPNMELKAYLLDWRLKEMEKIWITLKL